MTAVKRPVSKFHTNASDAIANLTRSLNTEGPSFGCFDSQARKARASIGNSSLCGLIWKYTPLRVRSVDVLRTASMVKK